MKWYYYYHTTYKSRFDEPLFKYPTKRILYWIGIFQKHLNIFTGNLEISGTTVDLTEHPFPTRGQPQPRVSARIRIYRKMVRWIRLMQRELDRRQNVEYRKWINCLIHGKQPVTDALIFADWCEDESTPPLWVLARQLRRWAEKETERHLLSVKVFKKSTEQWIHLTQSDLLERLKNAADNP